MEDNTDTTTTPRSKTRIISLIDDDDDVEIKPNITSSSRNNRPNNCIEDDDITIVEQSADDPHRPSISGSRIISTSPTTNTNTDDNDNGDSPKVVAIKNQQLLPHMRQHCTEHLFLQDKVFIANSNTDEYSNVICCKLCFCYVCDKVATECVKWAQHCFASDQGRAARFWKSLRSQTRRLTGTALEFEEKRNYQNIEKLLGISTAQRNAPALPSVSTARTNTSSTSNVFNSFDHASNRLCQRAVAPRQDLLREHPLGKACPPIPTPPEEILLKLTQCQHKDCMHYTRFAHENYTKKKWFYLNNDVWQQRGGTSLPDVPLNPTDEDWCGHCGRVASVKDYGKGNVGGIYPGYGDRIFKPVENVDVCVGHKTVPFTLISHDPRKFSCFRQNWNKAGSKLKYDAGIMDAITFEHRIGQSPSVKTLLGMIPAMETQYMPTTGHLRRPSREQINKPHRVPEKHPHHANETSGMIIESDNHVQLLSELFYFDWNLGKRTVNYTIKAKWHKRSRTGELEIALYLKPSVFIETIGSNNDVTHGMSIARLLMCWYEIPRFTLVQLGYCRKAKETSEATVRENGRELVKIPWLKSKSNAQREQLCQQTQKEKRCIKAHNEAVEDLEKGRTFEPSVEYLGGVSTSISISTNGGSDANGNIEAVTGFRSTMQRYFTECLPGDISQAIRDDFGHDAIRGSFISCWTARKVGILRPFHRRQQLHDAIRPRIQSDDLYGESPSTSLASGEYSYDRSYLTRDAHCLLWSNITPCRASFEGVPQSLPSLMNALENLGHSEGDVAERLLGQMTVDLLPFQRQAVQWALERENMEGGVQRLWWTKLPENRTGNAANKDSLWFSPALDMFSKNPPKRIRGGLICEEMGLGKTVISLALCLLNPAPATPLSGSLTEAAYANASSKISCNDSDWTASNMEPDSVRTERGRIISRGTLVVCHVSLVGQWVDEARSKLSDPGLVYPYYGGDRNRNPVTLAQNAIVVTTYAVLASDLSREGNTKNPKFKFPPCESIHWWRVICDESHSLRKTNSNTRAVLSLSAELRWCVTGTPLNTTVTDLRNQMDFIGFERRHTAVMFHRFLEICDERKKDRYGFKEPDRSRVGEFLMIMRSILMRHTSRQKTQATKLSLMQLPEKKDETVRISFGANELVRYKAMEDIAKKTYERARNADDFGRQYLFLMQSLNPMRMACSGGTAVEKDDGNEVVAIGGGIHQMTGRDGMHCSICLTVFNDARATPCKHVFCKVCIVGVLGAHGSTCPICRNFVHPSYLIPTLPPVVANGSNGNDTMAARGQSNDNHGVFRSKFNELLRQLKNIRDKESGSKSLIFSQFTSTLDFLQGELTKHGFSYRTLRGDMSMKARAKALRDFQNDPPTTVFLLSMRAGAVGINLTQANRVFLMEPALNPALVAQAVGRVHRIGQTKDVQIVRLIMKDSVEERMEELVKKKYGDAANQDSPAAKGAAATAIVGNLTGEKKAHSSSNREDFDLLFGFDRGYSITAARGGATTTTSAKEETEADEASI